MPPCSRLARVSAHLLPSASPTTGDHQVGRADILLPGGKTRSETEVPAHGWRLALQLDPACRRVGGSEAALAAAIGAGADMRVATNFPHSEHIDPTSGFGDLIGEVAGFAVTFVVHPEGGQPWVAGVQINRQPVECPTGFGPRASMSFFLYNQDGHQAIARPFLDGVAPTGGLSGPESVIEDAVAAAAQEKEKKAQGGLLADPGGGTFDPVGCGRAEYLDAWDSQSNAPSQNFIWHFDFFKFFTGGGWTEAFSHDADGAATVSVPCTVGVPWCMSWLGV